MSEATLAITPASATKWTVMSGPMKGTVRLMNAPVFLVGRSPECEFVVVNDPKCSRRHAQVDSHGYGCEVTSLNERNLVLVNGQPVERAPLNDGDLVTFGETEVQFNLTSSSAAGDLAIVDPGPEMRAVPRSFSAGAAPAAPAPRRNQRPRKGAASAAGGMFTPQRLGILAVVGLLLWLILSPTAKKKEVQIRTEQQIQAEIDAANKLRESSEALALKKIDQNVTSRQAQENYVRGFRDYKKGQFERALTSFQACLALNPEHVLCNRYIRLAQRKFDELIQYQVVLGRKYRDQNQYKACRAAFRNVMVMIKDANSRVFQEAKASYEACDSLVEGRY